MNLELWYRTFIDGEGIQTLAEPRIAESRTGESRIPNPESRERTVTV
jgi:hypothetical protein